MGHRVVVSESPTKVNHERTIHEVRHSAATILISGGMDPKTVVEPLGHESVRITLDIYTHVTKQSDDRAAALLDFGCPLTRLVLARKP